jgi:nitrate reductase gamma subunit
MKKRKIFFTQDRVRKIIASIIIGLVITAVVYNNNPAQFTEPAWIKNIWGRVFYWGLLIATYSIVGYAAWSFIESFSRDFFFVREDLAKIGVSQEAFQRAKDKAQEKPEDPAAAWEVASNQLQEYLKINLKQIQSIYQLSITVMLIGFALIVTSIALAMLQPEENSPALVAGIGGVVTEFIGGTFLFVYRSALEQSRHYIQTLDKTSSVGVALKILEGIEKRGEPLKEVREARIAIAKLLISQHGE